MRPAEDVVFLWQFVNFYHYLMYDFLHPLYTTVAWALAVQLVSVNATEHHKWEFNIGSEKNMVFLWNEPLPGPMLTKIHVTIWRHWATVSQIKTSESMSAPWNFKSRI